MTFFKYALAEYSIRFFIKQSFINIITTVNNIEIKYIVSGGNSKYFIKIKHSGRLNNLKIPITNWYLFILPVALITTQKVLVINSINESINTNLTKITAQSGMSFNHILKISSVSVITGTDSSRKRKKEYFEPFSINSNIYALFPDAYDLVI
eukprot:TRINITY_DN12707_c0_g1_i1.p5 TRINITY_DN12707_c0_g1~~TRINITY_DN12707_c0_g1_i1.p5  ORF type:complete len:152 (-),score=10.09 TRINITY_DN12707_c0_g1_i1:969-1424(-)